MGDSRRRPCDPSELFFYWAFGLAIVAPIFLLTLGRVIDGLLGG